MEEEEEGVEEEERVAEEEVAKATTKKRGNGETVMRKRSLKGRERMRSVEKVALQIKTRRGLLTSIHRLPAKYLIRSLEQWEEMTKFFDKL